MELIDKSKVVAELEKRIAEGENVAKELPSSTIMGLIQAYKNTLSFLDALEMKEVDLEKEIKKYIENNICGYCVPGVEETAKYFFELGLKAQKQ